jgi:hypothetical protein
MIARIFLFLALALPTWAADWALPAANQGAWTPGAATSAQGIGVPGGIDQYLAGGVNDRAVTGNVINVVTAHGADNTGASNCRDAIVAAIAAAASGDVIYFPAGTYLISSGFIYIPAGKSNVTLRGAGVGITTLAISTTSQVFIWPDPGYIPSSILTVSGTKTKGTSALNVSSSSGYSADIIALVRYENETDNARIQAGAAPVWSSGGFPYSRSMHARVTGVTSNTISIDPPLPGDGTNLTVQIYQQNSPSTKVVGWGVEDFTVTFNSTSHSSQAFNVQSAQYNWFYNVHFENWTKTTNSGSCIKINNSYRCEIRKCRFNAVAYTNPSNPSQTTSSDGAIESAKISSCLIEDNIFTGPFGDNIYDSGNSVNNSFSYNFSAAGNGTIFHNTHPSLNVVEGNAARSHHSDGYHGSSSHNSIFRNWYWGGNSIILNRFKRNYAVVGNLLGDDGVATGAVSWGNPNMGNGNANGFAGPTGLSDQVGQLDYQQNGGTPNTYTIVSGDVFAGDFWSDWEITGTLATRTSDLIGVFTVSGGNWATGDIATAGGRLYPTVYWNSKASRMTAGQVTAVSGSDVTIAWTSGTLPTDIGTPVQMYMGNAGWQERDLDVRASSTYTHNYISSAGGTGSVANSTADTLPASLVYTSKPDWFGALAWPPFNPNDATTQDITRIPAGYRYTYGTEDYLGPSAPTFSTHPTTQTAIVGDTVTLTVAGGGSPAPTLQWRKGGVNISGATSSSLVLINVQLADAGSYDCVATNSEGTATSSAAVLTVNAAPSEGATATIQTLNATTLNIAP